MSENTTASTSPGVPVEDPTPFGWLTTADHKRTGRLFIISSLAFLIMGVVLDLLHQQLFGHRLLAFWLLRTFSTDGVEPVLRRE